jgi:serine/threonine protein kinase
MRPDNRVVTKVDEVGSTANRYRLLARLAVGGMAEIFLARGASVAGLERYCVLKRILRTRESDAQFVRMFLDEARLAAQLQHPNIAQVYDIGMLGDSYFFTMEYVHGETVQSLMRRAFELHRPVPLACVLTIIASAAAGLHHAHDRLANDGRPLGIVHRDISPSNVMVSYEGNIKIVDFGVAKAAGRLVETKSGMVKGKIGYLSPEQCRGAPVDRRSDLFSLGVVAWEMLTGARLYRRPNDFENMTAIVEEPAPVPSSRRGDIPPEIDEVVLRLLAKSATDRFQTASEVVEAIEHTAMRAGMILSTSAVARLIRELFGVRPEPWLELDSSTLPVEQHILAARPLALDDQVDAVIEGEPDFAALPTLSTSNGLEQEFEGGSADRAISSARAELAAMAARTTGSMESDLPTEPSGPSHESDPSWVALAASQAALTPMPAPTPPTLRLSPVAPAAPASATLQTPIANPGIVPFDEASAAAATLANTTLLGVSPPTSTGFRRWTDPLAAWPRSPWPSVGVAQFRPSADAAPTEPLPAARPVASSPIPVLDPSAPRPPSAAHTEPAPRTAPAPRTESASAARTAPWVARSEPAPPDTAMADRTRRVPRIRRGPRAPGDGRRSLAAGLPLTPQLVIAMIALAAGAALLVGLLR